MLLYSTRQLFNYMTSFADVKFMTVSEYVIQLDMFYMPAITKANRDQVIN